MRKERRGPDNNKEIGLTGLFSVEILQWNAGWRSEQGMDGCMDGGEKRGGVHLSDSHDGVLAWSPPNVPRWIVSSLFPSDFLSLLSPTLDSSVCPSTSRYSSLPLFSFNWFHPCVPLFLSFSNLSPFTIFYLFHLCHLIHLMALTGFCSCHKTICHPTGRKHIRWLFVSSVWFIYSLLQYWHGHFGWSNLIQRVPNSYFSCATLSGECIWGIIKSLTHPLLSTPIRNIA